ncbi:MAG: ribulose-phosphate 3-epimerase [Anaerolineaceae bacterium]|nr:ribulose-phosphate 3-epimerase [Anaerolineaceae bacterium]
MQPITLSTSILSADFSRLGEQIHTAEEAGADWIHVDVMDGHFVPNISMGPFIVETCRKITKLPIDVHLMIENPERYIDAFAEAGATGISVHLENNTNIYRTLEHIRSLGCRPGIVINPGTPAISLSSVLPIVYLVLVMTVNPGYSGQEFIRDTVNKIAEVRDMIQASHSNALIQVDGGITHETLPLTYTAGARVFVAATAIFKYPGGIAAGIQALRMSVI